MLITGNLDLRPNANIIPIGKANAIPVQPQTSVTRRPPHLLVETSVKPNPPLSKKYAMTGKMYVKYKKYFLYGSFAYKRGSSANANITYATLTLQTSTFG